MYVFGSGRCVSRGLGIGFTNPVGTGIVLDVCLCLGLRWCRWGLGMRLGPGSGGVGWCYVYVGCESGILCKADGYLHIVGAPSVQLCCTLSISASYHVIVYGRYRKCRLLCVWLSDLDLSRHHLVL